MRSLPGTRTQHTHSHTHTRTHSAKDTLPPLKEHQI
uniref:Uncharacterized protein n=1 Tax=Anguilla anguilla TaxID=7936 RepID=A0A0E9W5W7_ANGAN